MKLLVLFSVFSALIYARELTITSFNIQWYGYEGGLPDDSRDKKIRDYMDRTISDSDVIVFQEIVNPSRLKKNVIGSSMKCRNYKHTTAYHQHVMLCYKPKFRFDRMPGDKNYKLESVAINKTKSRPAVWGVLKTKGGTPLVNIAGVHLKAYPKESDTRMEQTEALSEAVYNTENGLPFVLIGDFNSHYAKDTGERRNDDIRMDAIFKDWDLGLTQVFNAYPYTYRKGKRGLKLDRIWVSNTFKIKDWIYVSPPCNSEDKIGGGFDSVKYYNENVSDHCPLTTTLVY